MKTKLFSQHFLVFLAWKYKMSHFPCPVKRPWLWETMHKCKLLILICWSSYTSLAKNRLFLRMNIIIKSATQQSKVALPTRSVINYFVRPWFGITVSTLSAGVLKSCSRIACPTFYSIFFICLMYRVSKKDARFSKLKNIPDLLSDDREGKIIK